MARKINGLSFLFMCISLYQAHRLFEWHVLNFMKMRTDSFGLRSLFFNLLWEPSLALTLGILHVKVLMIRSLVRPNGILPKQSFFPHSACNYSIKHATLVRRNLCNLCLKALSAHVTVLLVTHENTKMGIVIILMQLPPEITRKVSMYRP